MKRTIRIFTDVETDQDTIVGAITEAGQKISQTPADEVSWNFDVVYQEDTDEFDSSSTVS